MNIDFTNLLFGDTSLTPVTEDDAEFILAVRSDPEVLNLYEIGYCYQ